jgi:hypothetical protein
MTAVADCGGGSGFRMLVSSSGNFRNWPRNGMPTLFRNVRSQGQSRKHVLALSFSGFDPERHRCSATHRISALHHRA